jgi:hypothetical protein
MIANHPFPLIQVLRLKKSEGTTKNQFAYARLLILIAFVFSTCNAAHMTPPARATKWLPKR